MLPNTFPLIFQYFQNLRGSCYKSIDDTNSKEVCQKWDYEPQYREYNIIMQVCICISWPFTLAMNDVCLNV